MTRSARDRPVTGPSEPERLADVALDENAEKGVHVRVAEAFDRAGEGVVHVREGRARSRGPEPAPPPAAKRTTGTTVTPFRSIASPNTRRTVSTS